MCTPPLLFNCEILCREEAESKDRNAILTSIEDVKLNYLQYLFLSLFLLFFKWKTNSKHMQTLLGGAWKVNTVANAAI